MGKVKYTYQTNYHNTNTGNNCFRRRSLLENLSTITNTTPQFEGHWQPTHELSTLHDTHPFLSLFLRNSILEETPIYTGGLPNSIIARSTRNSNMYITVKDLRELVSHNNQIYHELIKLSMEVLYVQHNGHYIDPSFSTNLSDHNWGYVSSQFATTRSAMILPTAIIWKDSNPSTHSR
jgi:hypothetical protein